VFHFFLVTTFGVFMTESRRNEVYADIERALTMIGQSHGQTSGFLRYMLSPSYFDDSSPDETLKNILEIETQYILEPLRSGGFFIMSKRF
jgi:hypothetical protein